MFDALSSFVAPIPHVVLDVSDPRSPINQIGSFSFPTSLNSEDQYSVLRLATWIQAEDHEGTTGDFHKSTQVIGCSENTFYRIKNLWHHRIQYLSNKNKSIGNARQKRIFSNLFLENNFYNQDYLFSDIHIFVLHYFSCAKTPYDFAIKSLQGQKKIEPEYLKQALKFFNTYEKKKRKPKVATKRQRFTPQKKQPSCLDIPMNDQFNYNLSKACQTPSPKKPRSKKSKNSGELKRLKQNYKPSSSLQLPTLPTPLPNLDTLEASQMFGFFLPPTGLTPTGFYTTLLSPTGFSPTV